MSLETSVAVPVEVPVSEWHEPFTTVLTFIISDGFQVSRKCQALLRDSLSGLISQAASLGENGVPAFPAAVRVEMCDKVYSRALEQMTERESGGAADSFESGQQAGVDDWAWLIVDTLETAFAVPPMHRISLHAQAASIIRNACDGHPSVYLPSVIRRNLLIGGAR